MNISSIPSATSFLPTAQAADNIKRRPATLKASSLLAYTKAVQHFQQVFGGQIPCDETTIQRYIASMRGLAAATVYMRVQGLRYEHVRLGHASPTEAPEMRTIIRQLQRGIMPGSAESKPKAKEQRKARPITRNMLVRMEEALGTNTLDRRDRCILLLGFSGALSCSTLVCLDVGDIRFTPDAMVLKVREAADLASPARQVVVPRTNGPLCAVAATQSWIQHAALDMEGGPLLRRFDRAGNPTADRLSSAWISGAVKLRLKNVGIDPEPFSGLSLRRGRIAEMAKGVM